MKKNGGIIGIVALCAAVFFCVFALVGWGRGEPQPILQSLQSSSAAPGAPNAVPREPGPGPGPGHGPSYDFQMGGPGGPGAGAEAPGHNGAGHDASQLPETSQPSTTELPPPAAKNSANQSRSTEVPAGKMTQISGASIDEPNKKLLLLGLLLSALTFLVSLMAVIVLWFGTRDLAKKIDVFNSNLADHGGATQPMAGAGADLNPIVNYLEKVNGNVNKLLSRLDGLDGTASLPSARPARPSTAVSDQNTPPPVVRRETNREANEVPPFRPVAADVPASRVSVVDVFNRYRAEGPMMLSEALIGAFGNVVNLSCVNLDDKQYSNRTLKFSQDNWGNYIAIEDHGSWMLLPGASTSLRSTQVLDGLFQTQAVGANPPVLVKAASIRQISSTEFELVQQGIIHV